MTSLAPTPIMVSLAQTAMNLPYFVLALPAGALADVMDRRRLLVFAQLWMMGSATILGILTVYGVTTPWVLLMLTFLLGVGGALNAPAYQAITPEVVSKSQLSSAVALNSVGINLARTIGPALGGFIVAASGSQAAFFFNAICFTGMIVVLYRWKSVARNNALPAERFIGAIRAGMRFMRHAPPLQTVLIRAAAFILCGSAFWALLPIIVRFEMQRGAGEYGTLLGCFGAGAVLGAAFLPRIRAMLSADQLTVGATSLFAGLLLLLSALRSFPAIGLALVVGGIAWLTMLSTLNARAQAAVPGWVRGRALAAYLLVFFGGMAVSSAVWGLIASWTGVTTALMLAATGLCLGLFSVAKFPLNTGEKLDLTPSQHWPVPVSIDTADLERRPVVVTVEYRIDKANKDPFLKSLHALREIRLRDGAVQWEVLSDTADPARYLEMFILDSWTEHLRQHERVSVTDREIEQKVKAFHMGQTAPIVTHFLTEVVY
jgi:MFS family permease